MPSIRLCKPKNSIDITLGAAYLINIVPIEPCSSSDLLDSSIILLEYQCLIATLSGDGSENVLIFSSVLLVLRIYTLAENL